MTGLVSDETSAPDAVIARIRKLFALAGSPNEHEAALALEKAHALLLRYNLRAETVTSGPGTRIAAGAGRPLAGEDCLRKVVEIAEPDTEEETDEL